MLRNGKREHFRSRLLTLPGGLGRLPGGGDGLQEEAENGSLGEGEEGVCRGRETEAGRLRGLLGTASISG